MSEPPAKRAHLDNELTTPTTRGGGEPLEDYTKMESIPPLPPPVKVSLPHVPSPVSRPVISIFKVAIVKLPQGLSVLQSLCVFAPPTGW